jgi:hypothetical protein
LGAFLEGWRRVLAAPWATLCLAAILIAAGYARGRGIPTGAWDPAGAHALMGHPKPTWTPEQSATYGAQIESLTRVVVDHLVRVEGLFPALVLWLFFAGGVLERLARGVPIGASAFFRACRMRVLVFARLAVATFVVYLPLSYALRPLPHGRVYFVIAILLIKVVLDFATARIIVEDRRSVIGAIAAAIRFAFARPLRVAWLYALNLIAYLVILRLWYQAAPTASTPGWAALLIALLYLLARVWSTLSFITSQIVFVEGETSGAHATALPDVMWPESPAAARS